MATSVFIELIGQFGFPIALSIFLIVFMTKSMNAKFDKMLASLQEISLKIGRTVLDKNQTRQLFQWCLTDHIEKKLQFLRDILRINHIMDRQHQIRANIKSEFIRITYQEANYLSQFNTPAGDIGKILLDNVNFDTFVNEVCEIFFKKYDNTGETCNDYLKINDIRQLMNGYVNKILEIIDSKMENM